MYRKKIEKILSFLKHVILNCVCVGRNFWMRRFRKIAKVELQAKLLWFNAVPKYDLQWICNSYTMVCLPI